MKDRIIQTIATAAIFLLVTPVLASAAQTHVVRSGDTLWSIARRYDVPVQHLAATNRLADPDALRLGQRLTIPGAAAEPARSAAGRTHLRHTVVTGDTLWSIARRYHVPVQKIIEANRLANPDALRLGQPIVIPVPVSRDPASATGPRVGKVTTLRPVAGATPSRGVKWGSKLLATASRQVGVRYRWGGMSPRGFDCSGFIGYVMRTVGVSLPRTSNAMWAQGRPVPRSQLRVGDIVFFNTTRPGPSHAGIYVGNNKFIHSSSGFGRVTVTSMDYPYYRPRYLGARRF